MESDSLNNTETEYETVISRKIGFYIFLLIDIPSILCSLLLFYYFIHLREQLHQNRFNQIIIYLLFSSFLTNTIDVPLIIIHFYNYQYVESLNNPNTYCIFWQLCDYIFYSLNLWLMALACFERYLMIFSQRIITTNQWLLVLLYYVSVFSITIFCFLWYIYLVFLYPCEQNSFVYTENICSASCYETVDDAMIQNIDWVLANLIPAFLVIFFLCIIVLHVIYHKYKISRHAIRRGIWKRTRKLFLQLFPIAFIFLTFNIPVITVGMLGVNYPWFNEIPYYYTNLLYYFLPMFMSFAILSKHKKIRNQFIILFKLRRRNRIIPFRTATIN
ncbi:hypothetical protein I4U23_016304 [Adineta vaga]|nr:hypothetical protein I4U23_016304 [Adineta vaga]